ncbi:hypothetical protein [Priestia megaterium]|uniref:hypothetical protein n=1 Tax=Priestia megaterium TaxID=1404 RepID=UPI003EE92510
MENQNIIVLDAPQVMKGNKICCHFKCLGEVSEYFKHDTFYIEMNENIKSVPKSILLIPALANICPIAWITGADIYVEEIDEDFLEALSIIKKSFQKLYPQHYFGGEIRYQEVKKNKGYGKGKSLLFFSGGVDSVTSYIRKRHEDPYLLTIWGADIPLSEKKEWGEVKNHTQQFAKDRGLTPFFIKSNLRSLLKERNLHNAYAKYGLKSWWGGIQHGLGTVGLSAPLSFIKGMNTIYFASSPGIVSVDHYLRYTSEPEGSHPSIENNLKWGETQAVLESMDLNRFDKIDVIAEYIRKHDSKLQLRVCWESKKGKNCGNCEKCARTMAGLLSKGLNPNKHGFSMSGELLQSIQNNKKLFTGLNENKKCQWKTLQQRLRDIVQDVNYEYYDFCQLILRTNFYHK